MTINSGEGPVVDREPERRRRRILVLSLELNFAPFSGNGVLARSLASSLARRGDCDVRVVCARPHASAEGLSKDVDMRSSSDGSGGGGLDVWPVDLPKHCKWRRLDRAGPWREYAAGCDGGDVARRVEKFGPTDVVAVDWHGMLAWESLRRNLSCETPLGDDASRPNVVYYNFRVYSASSWEHSGSSDDATESDDRFYREKEQMSCRVADGIVCLAEHDKAMLQRLMEEDERSDTPVEMKRKHIGILRPPLRGDVWELAKSHEQAQSYDEYLPLEARRAIKRCGARRKKKLFVTCMARFSPEKHPNNFVALLRKLGGAEFLKEHSLIPLMCGARSVEGYAREVIDEFGSMCASLEGEEAWPCVVIDHHLDARELAAVYARTAINVHPSPYDAYGMTLVESAAFGVPSIVNGGGKIGAASLLGEGKGCIAVNLEQVLDASGGGEGSSDSKAQTIESVRELFGAAGSNASREARGVSLKCIANEARCRALGWDEMACCQGLVDFLGGLPEG